MKKWALVAGVSSYQDSPLKYPAKDAIAVNDRLGSPEYNFLTLLLTDTEVTRLELLDAFDTINREQPDLFVFYFAGHGVQNDYGTFLATYDYHDVEPGLDIARLTQLLSSGELDRQVVAILDCCHAGAARARTHRSAHDPESYSSAKFQRAVQNNARMLGHGRVVLAACRDEEYAYESDTDEHGIYTAALIRGMDGAAADSHGEITPGNLHEYTTRIMVQSGQQQPVQIGEYGRIVLAEGFVPRPPPQTKTLNSHDVSAIVDAATRHLNGYLQSRTTDFEDWTEEGYRDACRALVPIVDWFERKAEIPEIAVHPRFKAVRSEVTSELGRLGHLADGLNTLHGRVKERIGGGGFGTVWKILHEPSEKHYAFKVYHPHELSLEDKQRRFRRGYEAMRQLSHPNVVGVHQFSESPIGFVMDYVPGPNLRDLAAGILDVGSTLWLLDVVASTLEHAHSRGVIHRDVKPENIILTYDEVTDRWLPHLTDFDLAWFSTATQVTKTGIGGAMYYAAPEQIDRPNSSAAHHLAVDIYSFGQLMYFALSRSDPTVVAREDAPLLRQLGGWPDASAAQQFLELYRSCTRLRPEERPESFARIRHQLRDLGRHFLGGAERALSVDGLLQEVGLRMNSDYGRAPVPRDGHIDFLSKSGRTSVVLSGTQAGRKANVSAQIRPHQGMAANSGTFESMRRRLNSAMDTYVSPLRGVTRRSGKSGAFEVFLDFEGVRLTPSGATQCQQILLDVVDIFERNA